MRVRRGLLLLALAPAALGGARTAIKIGERQGFDHWQHRKLFPVCSSCHAGAETGRGALWPQPADCAACHDGTIKSRVDWHPPAEPTPSNLRFTHGAHSDSVRARHPDSVLACTECHASPGASWMQVQRTALQQCLTCHGVTAAHLAAPDTACATCHVTLAGASGLSRERVARFPAPPSHEDPNFAWGEGHGALARPMQTADRHYEVAPSCATCHARDFCITCHVDAPEQRVIQALESDPRSLAHRAELPVPTSHRTPDFLTRHGAAARRTPKSCATCHTQESCLTCHIEERSVARMLHAAAPNRAIGAKTARRRPESHGADFTDIHGPVAASAATACATCHVRTDCLECHRPNAASGASGFHPPGFLARHPAAAYARETSCGDCHNSSAFCASCHAQAGLVAGAVLGRGFHDAKRSFLLGHGQAARQSLESCVGCHAERDCLTCHAAAAVGGRSFNPHGPGFDASRLRRRNPEMCTACHGQAIPGGSAR